MLTGGSLMHTVNQNTSASAIYGYLAILGTAVGCYNNANFSVAQAKAAQNKADKSSAERAVAFISVAQVGGLTLNFGIANSIFINEATKGLVKVLPHVPLSTVQSAIAGVGAGEFFNSLDPRSKEAALAATTTAISKVYVMVMVTGALDLILACFMKREKLFVKAKSAPTNQVSKAC